MFEVYNAILDINFLVGEFKKYFPTTFQGDIKFLLRTFQTLLYQLMIRVSLQSGRV